MLINHLRHFILLGVFVRRSGGSTAPTTSANDTLVRSGRDAGIKYLVFPQGSNVQGKDGKACVLKAICKTAKRRHEDVGKGSFLEETLHAVFTLPGGRYDIDPMTEYERTYHLGENCDEMHAKCPGVF